MDSRTEEVMSAFPGLRYDREFRITSPEDTDYNCIAWAMGRKDCWLWPDEEVEGVEVWPSNVIGSADLHVFVDAYKSLGFYECDNDEYEEGLEKIALYAYPDSKECTHASRQLPNGLWTSKLGPSYDICHSTPYTIQGRLYGMVAYILCRNK